MSKRAIGYWVATVFLALELVVGAILEWFHSNAIFGIMTTMTHLGYPVYVSNIFAVWKLLGAIAILAPERPVLKEWAYAGITFTMSGAIVSHLCSGDGMKAILPPLVFLIVTAVSWMLRPDSRRCTTPNPSA
jgi:hypothetical protein